MTTVYLHAQLLLPDGTTPDSGTITFAPRPYAVVGIVGLVGDQAYTLDADGLLEGDTGAALIALDTAGYYEVTLALRSRYLRGTLVVNTDDAADLNLMERADFGDGPGGAGAGA